MTPENKVLSCAPEAYGHTVPALALGLALRARGSQLKMISFGSRMEQLFRRYDVSTIELAFPPLAARDWRPITLIECGSKLKSILREYEPEITICDWSLPLWLALAAWRPRCRVSILRCEILPGYQRRSLFLPDKFGMHHGISQINQMIRRLEGVPLVKDPRELCGAEIIIVPSIPQIDPLPEQASEFYASATIVYTGPLLLPAGTKVPESLKDWLLLRRKEGLPILLVTLGTAWGDQMYSMLADCLSRTELAVVMIVPQEEVRHSLEQRSGARFQVTDLTELVELAGYADAVMHHCGHGTLQSVLLAGKPSLTLPSGEYDREDNALRMEDMCCGRHFGHDFFRKGLNADAISRAVKEVLTDASIAEGVSAVSRVIHRYHENGLAEFVQLVERSLH